MDYNQLLIKQFQHWALYLHESQFPNLGRCYASALRSEADIVTDINPAETEELFFKIIPSWHRTVKELYGECRPNVAILGNLWPHLHAHLVPRHKENKQFYGIEFADPNPKGLFIDLDRNISSEILFKIRDEIKKKI
ncbi:MAG TPA: hypothetical protein VJC39_04340 [Candidatus Nanoarchaeia archaeon]|nr:hypothetical protein [Candidatus Nanoarchaeia archaeon]